MKKMFFLVSGFLLLAVVLSAQTAQTDATTFAGGGYTGQVLEPITIADLQNAQPNAWIILSGYLVQQRVPGVFILADDATNPTISVVVYFTGYGWANLQVDATSQVLVYGTVSKSELRTEIFAERIEVCK